MKKKLNEIKEAKKMAFEKVSVLELNQLKTIKGGLENNGAVINGNGANDNTYSLTDVANGGQANYSEKC